MGMKEMKEEKQIEEKCKLNQINLVVKKIWIHQMKELWSSKELSSFNKVAIECIRNVTFARSTWVPCAAMKQRLSVTEYRQMDGCE